MNVEFKFVHMDIHGGSRSANLNLGCENITNTLYMHAQILQAIPQVAPWSVFRAMQCASKAFQQSPVAMFTARRRFRVPTAIVNSTHVQFLCKLPNGRKDGRLYNVVDAQITHVRYYTYSKLHGVHVQYMPRHWGVRVKYVAKYIDDVYHMHTYYCVTGSMFSHKHRFNGREYTYELSSGADKCGCGEFIMRVTGDGVAVTRLVHPHDDKLWLECCGHDVFAIGDISMKHGGCW